MNKSLKQELLPLSQMLVRLWSHISRPRRRQIYFLSALMIMASFAEILAIGSVLPFLGALAAPERIYQLSSIQLAVVFFDLTDSSQIMLPLTILFVLALSLSAFIRLAMLKLTAKISFLIGAEIGLKLYANTLSQPYSVHISRNSSEVISGISGKVNGVIYNVILPGLTFVSSSVILVSILLILMYISLLISLIAFLVIASLYYLIIKMTRERIKNSSILIANESIQVIKSLQEGLGGIRDVLIDGTQAVYIDAYSKSDYRLRRAQSSNFFISQSPRYLIEAFGMSMIATLAYFLTKESGGVEKAISVLGAFALGAQKLLPILQQTYGAFTNIRAEHASLSNVIELLDQAPMHINQTQVFKPITFEKTIVFKDVSFKYSDDSDWIIKDFNFTVSKGDCIGVIGSTGSGKTTLLDLLMGLLEPTSGNIYVDGTEIKQTNMRNWQLHISHVPQSIFLSDSTIEENIALGISKNSIDPRRLKLAASRASIHETIESFPNGYHTLVGERGVRLSGGQRQRIGIARALYKMSDVIIFDEATSALDNQTEEAVMNSIGELQDKVTLFIIAHRLTTLKKCNKILELSNGKLNRVGSYDQIIR